MSTTRVAPVLLLHGALGAASQFDALRSLLGSGFETFAIDFEGHGNARDSGRPYSLDSFASDILRALDERGIERAPLFGHSLGGFVALHLALTHPDRVERACSLATKLAWTSSIATSESARLIPEVVATKVPAYAALLERRHTAFDWKYLMPKIAAFLAELGRGNPLTPERLAGIARPVRIAVGDRDTFVTLEECAAAYRAIPIAELHVLPGTPHQYEKSAIGRIAQLIRDFYDPGRGTAA